MFSFYIITLIVLCNYNTAIRIGDPTPKPLTDEEKVLEAMWRIYSSEINRKLSFSEKDMAKIKERFPSYVAIDPAVMADLKKLQKNQPHYFAKKVKDLFTFTDYEVTELATYINKITMNSVEDLKFWSEVKNQIGTYQHRKEQEKTTLNPEEVETGSNDTNLTINKTLSDASLLCISSAENFTINEDINELPTLNENPGSSIHIATDISKNMPTDTSTNIPGNMPTHVSTDTTTDLTTVMSSNISADTPKHLRKAKPMDIPTDTSHDSETGDYRKYDLNTKDKLSYIPLNITTDTLEDSGTIDSRKYDTKPKNIHTEIPQNTTFISTDMSHGAETLIFRSHTSKPTNIPLNAPMDIPQDSGILDSKTHDLNSNNINIPLNISMEAPQHSRMVNSGKYDSKHYNIDTATPINISTVFPKDSGTVDSRKYVFKVETAIKNMPTYLPEKVPTDISQDSETMNSKIGADIPKKLLTDISQESETIESRVLTDSEKNIISTDTSHDSESARYRTYDVNRGNYLKHELFHLCSNLGTCMKNKHNKKINYVMFSNEAVYDKSVYDTATVKASGYQNRRSFYNIKVGIENFPFLASISENNIFQCSGCIISDQYIITAASCLELKYTHPNQSPVGLSVRVGSNHHSSGGKQIEVAEVHIHPKYDVGTDQNNLALLKLGTKIPLEKNVIPIKLDRSPDDISGVTVLGWGDRQYKGKKKIEPFGTMFSKSHYRITDLRKCQSTYTRSQVTDKNFCAFYESRDACNNDLGGPGISGTTLVGVISFTYPGCSRSAPIVFTRVNRYIKWIDKVMNGHTMLKKKSRRPKMISNNQHLSRKSNVKYTKIDDISRKEESVINRYNQDSKNIGVAENESGNREFDKKHEIGFYGNSIKTRGYVVYNTQPDNSENRLRNHKSKQFETTIIPKTAKTLPRLRNLITNKNKALRDSYKKNKIPTEKILIKNDVWSDVTKPNKKNTPNKRLEVTKMSFSGSVEINSESKEKKEDKQKKSNSSKNPKIGWRTWTQTIYSGKYVPHLRGSIFGPIDRVVDVNTGKNKV